MLIERVEMSTVHIGNFDTAMFAWQTRLAIFPKDYRGKPDNDKFTRRLLRRPCR